MKTTIRYLQIFLLFTLIAYALFFIIFDKNLHWENVWAYRRLFIKGWVITLALSCAGLLLSVLIGFFTALLRKSSSTFISLFVKIYIEWIRGTPLLVQILLFFYVVAHMIGLENRYVAGIIILSIFHGAYIAEMMRAGIDNVSATQLESARAIGLSTFQSYRFVILPQAFRQIIPPLAGQFASIIKDSSLLSIIGINELTNSAQQINSASYSTLESYLPLAAGYLILTLPISLWSKSLEKKYHYEH